MSATSSGASAAVHPANGESPLHWLLSFDPDKVDVDAMAKALVRRGGASVDALAAETPFQLAVRRNAFRLADRLRHHGADMDALTTRSAMLVSPHPLTGLGHAIALNARTGLPALQYLLPLGASCEGCGHRSLT